MPRNLVEVGIAARRWDGNKGLTDEALQTLVQDALRAVDTKELLVRCILLLATADWCQAGSSLPKRIRSQFKEGLGYEAPLIGGSMAGLYCSAGPDSANHWDPFIERGLVLVVFCSNDLVVSVRSLKEPYSLAKDERQRALYQLAEDLEGWERVKLGAGARISLFGFLPGVVLDDRNHRSYFDNDLHEEILHAFGHKYQLFGASASNKLDSDKLGSKSGYQFANDECLESGLALALLETDLSTGATMTHGFAPMDNLRVSIDGLADGAVSGYCVTRLDGMPAVERLRELKAQGLISLDRPVFGLPYGSDFEIFWAEKPDEGEGGIRLKRKVSLGDRIYLLDATPDAMLRAGEAAFKLARDRSGASLSELILFLCFTCASRFKHYQARGAQWMEAPRRVQDGYPGVPMIIGLCGGEFGVDQRQDARANNMSVSVISMANAYSRHAAATTLHTNLRTGASGLLTSDSPVGVMKAALKGALNAGATGGQICLVDQKLERILGEGFGYAEQSHRSAQNWAAVAKMTDRAAPKNSGGRFPPELRKWSMLAVAELPSSLDAGSYTDSPDEDEEEDILTLIVRTLRAVFVPDSNDPMFHCGRAACDSGNIVCQLVIPLVGSHRKAIATLQVSFEDDTVLDSESFALWVSYGQKVAAALERSQEFEERRLLNEIAEIGDKILLAPVDTRKSPDETSREYLLEVLRLIGADGAHMRVPTVRPSSYELIAPVGHLADLLPQTRQVIELGDDSYKWTVLKQGGWVSNVKDKTAVFLEKLKNAKLSLKK